MTGIEALRSRVASKKASVDEARQQLALLEAEYRVWQEALMLVDGSRLSDPITTVDSASIHSDGNDRRRGPKGPWRKLMPIAADKLPATGFDYGDFEQLAKQSGSPVVRNTLRSQMGNYVISGLLERVSEGKFRFTQKGRDEFSSLSIDTGTQEPEEDRSGEDGAHSQGLHAGGHQPPDALSATGDRDGLFPEGG